MASGSGDFLHWKSSILKKGGITGKVKKVHFNATLPEKLRLANTSKKRPIDVDAQMVYESYSKAKKKRKERHLSLKEASNPEDTRKKSKGRVDTVTTQILPQPVEYEVEAILDHKKHDGDYLYLLKWKGYSDEENSWEPSSNLSCNSLLDAYREKHNLNPRPSNEARQHHKSSKLPHSEGQQRLKSSKLSENEDRHHKASKLPDNASSKLIFQKKKEELKERSSDYCWCSSNDKWSVQANKHMMRLKRLKMRRKKRRSLIVSIDLRSGVSLNDSFVDKESCQVSSTSTQLDDHQSDHDDVNDDLTGIETYTTQAHRVKCMMHDHTYYHLLDSQSPKHPQLPILTPPPSAEPCNDEPFNDEPFNDELDFTDHSKPPFCVQISPLPSPSPPPTPPRNCHISMTEVQSQPPPSPQFHAMQSDIHDIDSDCSSQVPMDSNNSSPCRSSPRFRLHMSSASSDCDTPDSQLHTRPRDWDESNLSEQLQSVLTYTYRNSNKSFKSHSTNGGILSKWRKGPVPLPKSFSKRHSTNSQLPTKAAKLQLPDHLPTYAQSSTSKLLHMPHTNGLLNHPKPHSKLSLSLKSRSLGLEEVRAKKLKKAFANSTTNGSEDPSGANCDSTKSHAPVVTSGRDVQSLVPVKPNDLMYKYAYKEKLMNWQYELNKQRGGTDDIIYVENDVDMEPPPTDFIYICSNVYAPGIPNPCHPDIVNSLCGCECYYLGHKCGRKSEYCCANMAGSKFAYTLAGKVRVPPGTPIYECNAKCSCPSDCSNRIVQLGRKIPLCIFRTVGRGWGVKTIEPIKPNTFITEYVGEVIGNEEAERRGKKCDARGITYLFDLDFEDDNSAFTIDAAKYGNISHFFNHSCNPNLVVYSVWIDTLDKRLPRLAFFTTRSISTGEELTFDYQMNRNCDYPGGCGPRMPCLCGSKNCLGYIN